MAGINQTISLVDNVSPTLSKIQKQALANVAAYEKLEKQAAAIEKQMQTLERTGRGHTEAYEILNDVLQETMNTADEYLHNRQKATVVEEENASSTDASAQSMSDLNASMTELNQTLEAAQKAWRVLTRVMREANEWMQASNVQFNAEFTAASKMHTVLGASADEIQSLYDYAKALQKVGVVGDESVIAGMSALSMYTKNTDQIKQLIPKILDMAVQENGLNTSMSNVSSTATIVGRALTGQMMMLKRQLGLTDEQAKAIDELTNEEEKFNAILNVLNSRVGKANEVLATTSQGGIKQANNALGDLQERLGYQVVPYFELFNKVLVDILTPIVDFVEANSDWVIPVILGVTGVLGGLIIATTVQTLANSALAKSFLALAPKVLAATWPLLIVVGVLWLFIELMNNIMGTEFSLLDVTIGIVYLVKAIIQNLFITIGKIIQGILGYFVELSIVIMNILGWIASGIDAIFGTSLSQTVGNFTRNLEKTRDALFSNVAKDDFVDWQAEAAKGVEVGRSISKSITEGTNLGIDGLISDLDSLITTDNFGSPAMNTTSKDNLLKDEDIQLLLDVATRDYKLNYQQITPEVIMNLNVDQAMDIDYVMEEFSNRMQEAIEQDMEVVPA